MFMEYTSNLTKVQYDILEPLLPVVKTTKPRKYTYHQILNAIMYTLVSWCQRRNIPKDLVPRETAYHYYYIWKNDWVFDKLLVELHKQLRKKIWKNEQPSLVIIDSQAVKNTNCAKEKWRCHYKCVNWIKRHMLVDVLWIPISILVTTANVNDRTWWRKLAKENKELLIGIKTMLADWWYSWKWFKISIKKRTGITVQIAPKPTRSKNQWFRPEYKRRIVERSNARMDKCRRLHKNNERYLENSEAVIKICFIRIIIRRLFKPS